MQVPTLDEYTEFVKEHLSHYLDKEDLEKCMNSAEAKEEIQLGYDEDLEAYRSGKWGYKGFGEGKAGSVAWCLWMLCYCGWSSGKGGNVPHKRSVPIDVIEFIYISFYR